MELYRIVVFFIFGITFGSFYNVVGLRMPKKLSFVQGHSHCPNCDNQLQWHELIPIGSYLWQRGECKHCHTPISILYPLIEVITGLLFAYSYYMIGFQVELIISILFISMLAIITVSDILYMVIPNRVLLFFLPLLIVFRIISPLDPSYDMWIGAIIGFSLIALIIILSKGGMGAGDMKLFFVLGIVLGWQKVLLTLFLASLLGAVIGICLKYMQKIKPKQPIPFGPYIALAAIITYFYGDILLFLYLSLL